MLLGRRELLLGGSAFVGAGLTLPKGAAAQTNVEQHFIGLSGVLPNGQIVEVETTSARVAGTDFLYASALRPTSDPAGVHKIFPVQLAGGSMDIMAGRINHSDRYVAVGPTTPYSEARLAWLRKTVGNASIAQRYAALIRFFAVNGGQVTYPEKPSDYSKMLAAMIAAGTNEADAMPPRFTKNAKGEDIAPWSPVLSLVDIRTVQGGKAVARASTGPNGTRVAILLDYSPL